MNEQNKKLLECAEFIKENCNIRGFCDGCVFHKREIERDEYTNEPINYYDYCEIERKTYPCNWHFEDIITICDYCENKNNQDGRCLDCPAKLKGNEEK